MSEEHEVYPSAPLALVAVEVRFPESAGSSPLPVGLQRSFRDLLGPGWVIESAKAQRVSVSLGPEGVAQQAPQLIAIPRFTVRDRTLAIAVTDESVTVEATRYRHYPEFRAVLESALDAAGEVLDPDGVTRVGMRYIDEIRVPGMAIGDVEEWSGWLDASLLPPQPEAIAAEGFNATAWDGAVQYLTGNEMRLVLRYGTRTGYVVNPAGPLKRPSPPPPGPLFILDFDSFWEPTDIPEYDADSLLAMCDSLRRPIRVLFDSLTTDSLLSLYKKERTDG